MNIIIESLIMFIIKYVLSGLGFLAIVIGIEVILRILNIHNLLNILDSVLISFSLSLILWGSLFVIEVVKAKVD